MARIAGKLNNEKFVANANPEVVAARARAAIRSLRCRRRAWKRRSSGS